MMIKRLRLSPIHCMVIGWALWPILSLAQEPTAEKKLEITDVRIGFENVIKGGHWAPIAVDILARGAPFQGSMVIATPDADGIQTTIRVDNFAVPANSQATVRHFIKLASEYPAIEITLIDPDGKRAARKSIDPGNAAMLPKPSDCALILSIGDSAGLRELDDPIATENESDVYLPASHHVIPIQRMDELPSQWFVYEAIDAVVLGTQNQPILDAIDPGRASALASWVRSGGHVVLSVANNWQNVSASFLGPLMPAAIEGVETVANLSPQAQWLDLLAGNKSAIDLGKEGLLIAKLSQSRGIPLPSIAASGQSPLIVRGAYGLGTVTLLGFDTEMAPFSRWNGRTDFWREILSLQRESPADMQNKFNQPNELANHLEQDLNRFSDVTVVPFSWVAILIVGYIILIGPVDYFFLKRVVGRLELTWITFPLIVLGVSIAAYYAAYWLKGDDLRLNRIDIVDIDHDSRTLRGANYLSLFSPVIARYTISSTPGLGADGTWQDLGMGRAPVDRVTSWMPTFSNYNVMRGGGGILGSGEYRFASPDPVAVIEAPIKVWSVKSFTSQWLARAGTVIDTDLKQGEASEAALVGSITNRLSVRMHDAVLVWEQDAYELGTIEPGESATLDSQKRKTFQALFGVGQSHFGGAPLPPNHLGRDFFINLTFSTRKKAGATGLVNNELIGRSLEPLRHMGKAILLARVDVPGGELWINDLPGEGRQPPAFPGIERSTTYVRIVLEPQKS